MPGDSSFIEHFFLWVCCLSFPETQCCNCPSRVRQTKMTGCDHVFDAFCGRLVPVLRADHHHPQRVPLSGSVAQPRCRCLRCCCGDGSRRCIRRERLACLNRSVTLDLVRLLPFCSAGAFGVVPKTPGNACILELRTIFWHSTTSCLGCKWDAICPLFVPSSRGLPRWPVSRLVPSPPC